MSDIMQLLNNKLSADKMGNYTPNELAGILISEGIVDNAVDMNRIVIEGIQKALIDDDEFPIHYYTKDEEMREEGKEVKNIGDQLTDEYIEYNLK